MDALEMLTAYKQRFDPIFQSYFRKKIQQASANDSLAEEAVRMIADFALADGKRIRPAIFYYSYLGWSTAHLERVVWASMSIELAHTFLLIHDDIIDRDATRHGVPTLHEQYRAIGHRLAPSKNAVHFGNSMAMIAGDMAASMANEVLYNIDFPPKRVLALLDALQRIIYVTIPGEMLDVVMEMRGNAPEREILRMHEGKTARYTFEGPMHLGGVLAGVEQSILKLMSDFALPLGIAFQIRDDILSVYGSEKKLGKPVGSDIIEGKQTLLLIHALRKANQAQRKELQTALGNAALTQKQLDTVRLIMQETGALAYSEQKAEKLVRDALAALKKVPFHHPDSRSFFEGIARYVIQRHT